MINVVFIHSLQMVERMDLDICMYGCMYVFYSASVYNVWYNTYILQYRVLYHTHYCQPTQVYKLLPRFTLKKLSV